MVWFWLSRNKILMKSYVGQKSFISLVSHFKWTIFHRSEPTKHYCETTSVFVFEPISEPRYGHVFSVRWTICGWCVQTDVPTNHQDQNLSFNYTSKFKNPSRFFWWGILMYSEWHFFCWMDFDTTCYLAEEWEVFKVDFPESLLFLFMHTTLKSIMCW